jgi:membrane protease YdiL (CAAX protease family)
VIAPVIEEIIFRGFLQEKIRNIQVFVFGAKLADHKVNKVIRVGLQAIVFGLAHVRPDQAGINGIIFLITGIGGAYNGYLKEKTKTLWCSMAEHAHWNASSTVSIIANHFIPYYHAPAPTAVPAARILAPACA